VRIGKGEGGTSPFSALEEGGKNFRNHSGKEGMSSSRNDGRGNERGEKQKKTRFGKKNYFLGTGRRNFIYKERRTFFCMGGGGTEGNEAIREGRKKTKRNGATLHFAILKKGATLKVRTTGKKKGKDTKESRGARNFLYRLHWVIKRKNFNYRKRREIRGKRASKIELRGEIHSMQSKKAMFKKWKYYSLPEPEETLYQAKKERGVIRVGGAKTWLEGGFSASPEKETFRSRKKKKKKFRVKDFLVSAVAGEKGGKTQHKGGENGGGK